MALCEISSSLDSFKYNLNTALAQVFDAPTSDCGVHVSAAYNDSVDPSPDNCFGTGWCSTGVITGLQCYNERGAAGTCTSFDECYRFSMRVTSCLG
jgi:hypothetical protein